jgi:hypothetical protein
VKCNIDASMFKEQGCHGVGICLKGDYGMFVLWTKISVNLAW